MYQPLIDFQKPINKKELCLAISIIVSFQLIFGGIIILIENIDNSLIL